MYIGKFKRDHCPWAWSSTSRCSECIRHYSTYYCWRFRIRCSNMEPQTRLAAPYYSHVVSHPNCCRHKMELKQHRRGQHIKNVKKGNIQGPLCYQNYPQPSSCPASSREETPEARATSHWCSYKSEPKMKGRCLEKAQKQILSMKWKVEIWFNLNTE